MGKKENNYFKVVHDSNGLGWEILAVFTFDDTILEDALAAYYKARFYLMPLVVPLQAVRHDPTCPYRLQCGSSFMCSDWRQFRLLTRHW